MTKLSVGGHTGCRALVHWCTTRNENAAWDVPRRRSACCALLARGDDPPEPPAERSNYLTVTEAPAPSRAAFAFSAASLLTFSRTVFGAPSTRSLASLSPR